MYSKCTGAKRPKRQESSPRTRLQALRASRSALKAINLSYLPSDHTLVIDLADLAVFFVLTDGRKPRSRLHLV